MNIVILTGAGISAESGLKTFRGQDGLWEGHRIEEVATPEAFLRDPDLVYHFYNLRRAQLLSEEVQPNPAHLILADFEKKHSGSFQVVTQNVDNLHEKAGSQNVIHMHGELQKVRCLKTGKVYPWLDDLDQNSPHPDGIDSPLRPHIVWFGEMPLYMEEIENLLNKCDLFIAIGTSGVVYPAAGFVNWTQPQCRKVEFNVEKTAISEIFDETILGPASETLENFLSGL